ncbi:cellulase family glycosylhydrolase [Yinghuangia seranimata]|uniref:cellulase family glycosylhydrolase n=1 Tax=Yinghuangia seranimata TaxID=408067 RepID=UPI00248AAA5A|nr:cellulase family glycosylhydrolase [Yinghuangia seranimata]MDI2126637.1 cellulase family glycosylhydrolase [Yinghuangia seranimata]
MRHRLHPAVSLTAAALLVAAVPGTAEAHPGHGHGRPDRVTVGDRTYIADEQGRATQWRGFNLSDKGHRGTEAFADIHESDLRDMAARGFNLARLAFFWDDLEPTRGHYDRSYLAKMRRILDWADKYHVKVVLDAHQDIYGPHFGARGIPDWATRDDGLPFEPIPNDWFSEYFEPSVQTAFDHLYNDRDLRAAHARMWMTVAASLGHHPALLGYDLMNEPFAKFLEGEDLPTAAARFEATELTEMWNRLADAVRLVDRDSWVFVEPTVIVGLGVPTSLGTIDDPHAGYAPHFYETAMESGADYDPSGPFIPNYVAAIGAYPAQHRMPVIVGEWGGNPTTPNAGRFINDMTAAMNGFADGWTWWQWCRGNGGYCNLNPAGEWRPNTDLLAQPYARAVAGNPLSTGYDPATHTFKLTYTTTESADGPTEITVPRVAYPGGFRVSVDGAKASWDDRGQTVRVSTHGRPGGTYTVTITPR